MSSSSDSGAGRGTADVRVVWDDMQGSFPAHLFSGLACLLVCSRWCPPPPIHRYASMLEVTMDPHLPHVCDIHAEELVSFCHDR